MAVGELFLAAFLQVLFDRLASRELLNLVRRDGLGKKLDKWKDKLEKIQAVIDDADEKQGKVGAVKLWLDDLTDLAYDVEDILDEFSTDISSGENQGSSSKVRRLTLACCTPFSAVKANINLWPKVNKITDRFNDIVKEKDQLRLREIVDRRRRGTPSTSFVHEDRVYGREREKDAILELLLSETYNNDAEVSVISIHGMGGVGKTTLAQLVFNAKEVHVNFDVKVWAYVSDDFNVLKVTQTILISVIRQSREAKYLKLLKFIQDDNLDFLQGELHKQLCGKKFLFILDDVWTRDYQQWNNLRAPFLKGTPESRIIITTRDREVSSKMGTVPAYPLQVLSNDACFSIFTLHALRGRGFSSASNLKGIGKKIGEKCKGLPLAALTFAGLLRSEEPDHRKWEEVSIRRILDEPEERDEILSVLMWSYHDLPLHLKRCFAHCSIIPEGYEFEEQQLVLLWMAEGLIQPQREKQMEDLGSEYFQELVKKSFFQKSSNNESRFTMHDFINNLAQWVARGTFFRMDDRSEGILKKARHLSCLCGHGSCHLNFEALSELTHLRTFLPLVLPNQGQCSLTCNISLQLLPKLGCLRVLSLSGYCITELPESIGDLKHLRYLDLSNTSIKSMPESTTTLYNLQTLILENCSKLMKLPSMFQYLVNMRHLNIQNACSLEGMPPKMGKLTCLQTLSDLVVGKGPCSGVEELGSLSHLRETLNISRLENVIQPGDATKANLIQKAKLDGLLLEWSHNLDEPQDGTIDLAVLNELQPHGALKELIIRCYGGTEFPTWLRTPSFPNMVRLRLENCKKCKSLPSVGQLSSLKYLSIIGMAGVEEVGPEFYEGGCLQPFGSLETLCFKNMEEWRSWNPCEEFPHLRELSIQNCPKLSGRLPNYLPLTVDINGCPLLQ